MVNTAAPGGRGEIPSVFMRFPLTVACCLCYLLLDRKAICVAASWMHLEIRLYQWYMSSSDLMKTMSKDIRRYLSYLI